MGVTLNKDGRPRKIGSGKTKGAGCYAKITWKELKDLVDEDSPIQVSRVWLKVRSESVPENRGDETGIGKGSYPIPSD